MKVNKELVARIRSGMASEQELRDAGRENVLAIKSDGEAMHFRFSIKRKPASLNDEQRTVEHVASTEDVDRMGDRIAVRGWDLANWQKNPVVLWDHQQGGLPIGRGLKARKASDEGVGPALLITSQFHGEDKNPQAQLIYRMVADGDLPAGSVGFNPLEILRPKSEDESKEFGLGEYGVYFKRQELLEWSIVTVPAHAGALVKRIEAKLDALAKAGEYSWAVLDAVSKALRGEAPERRVFAVPDMACVVVDELESHDHTRGGAGEQRPMIAQSKGDHEDIEHDPSGSLPVLQLALRMLSGHPIEVSMGEGANIPMEMSFRAMRGASIEEIRALMRDESSGIEASARLIRAIVRDEITAALSAANKSKGQPPQVSPTATPAGSGEGVELNSGKGPDTTDTKGADLYDSVLSAIKSASK